MNSTYGSGMGLPANLDTQFGRATGAHFPGAPAAAFNPGPAASSSMSIFGSKPSGEIMFSASDDHLYAEAVAPVMYPFAVITDIDSSKLPKLLEKGTVVNIGTLSDSDISAKDAQKAKKRAERAGKSLRVLNCHHCEDPDKVKGGIVGVLAESVLIKKDPTQFNMVTVALENATEVRVPPKKKDQPEAKYRKAGDTIRLKVHENAEMYRYATVLTGYYDDGSGGTKHGGGHYCLHPGLFKTSSRKDASGARMASSSRGRATRGRFNAGKPPRRAKRSTPAATAARFKDMEKRVAAEMERRRKQSKSHRI